MPSIELTDEHFERLAIAASALKYPAVEPLVAWLLGECLRLGLEKTAPECGTGEEKSLTEC